MPTPQRFLVTLLLVTAAVAVAACGSSGTSSQASAGRTVQIEVMDQLRFTPDNLSVKPGETVRFQIQNSGTVAHEFVLGDQRAQDQHEQDMQGMGGMGGMNVSAGNAVDVPAGQTKTLTFTFPAAAGTLLYGCHVNGHYAAGMRGAITIS